MELSFVQPELFHLFTLHCQERENPVCGPRNGKCKNEKFTFAARKELKVFEESIGVDVIETDTSSSTVDSHF